jgi:hypothetical protein
MKPQLAEGPKAGLRCRPGDRGHTGLPPRRHLDFRRQAGGVHQALGVRDRPLVERSDATRERFDEPVELGVGLGPVHVAISLSQIAPDVVRPHKHFHGAVPTDQTR